MNISQISVSQIYVSSQTLQINSTTQNSLQENGTPHVSGGHHHHHSGGGELMQAVKQALSQMGLILDFQSSSSSQASGWTDSSSAAAATMSGTSTAANSQQALHAFMHDLFGALRNAKDQANGTGGSTGGDTNSITFQLQVVIESLGSSDTTSFMNDPLSNLQTDFSSLVSPLGDGNSSNETQFPDVQSFLQNVLQNETDAAGGNENGQAGEVQSGYPTDMASQLQDLINALESTDSFSTQNTDLNNLQSDFQSLVSSLGGGDSSEWTQSSDLQVFLQNLMQNLPAQQSISLEVGSFVSTVG